MLCLAWKVPQVELPLAVCLVWLPTCLLDAFGPRDVVDWQSKQLMSQCGFPNVTISNQRKLEAAHLGSSAEPIRCKSHNQSCELRWSVASKLGLFEWKPIAIFEAVASK